MQQDQEVQNSANTALAKEEQARGIEKLVTFPIDGVHSIQALATVLCSF
jgi:hypothetical protein